MNSLRRFFQALKAERTFLIMSSLTFIIFSVIGYLNHQEIMEYLQRVGAFDQLKDVVNKIDQDPTFMNVFFTLYGNNMIASFSMIGMGFFLGIIPLISLIGNGLMLGVAVASAAEVTGTHPLHLFATGILPHGILELPAIIIAASLGIRFGIFIIRSFIGIFSSTVREENKKDWKELRKHIGVLMISVVILLFFAAIIESILVIYVKPLG